MFTHFHAGTADELWLQSTEGFRERESSVQNSRAGDTKEILNVGLCLKNPRHRWIPSRSPALNPAFAFAEVIWILSGRNDSAFLNYFNSRLPDFAGSTEKYHGAYGYRLRKLFERDQLKAAYEALTANAESRQVVLQIWDSDLDMPHPDGKPVSEDVPCNICSFLKIRNGKLQWSQMMRSNDVFIGLPYNIIQFTYIHEIMAGWLNCELGEYHHYSDSLHLYLRDYENLSKSSQIEYPQNTDSIFESYGDTQITLGLMQNLVEIIINEDNNGDLLSNRLQTIRISPAWKNIASILVAEGLRRRGEVALTEAVLENCGNELYRFLFSRWKDVTKSKRV